MSTVTFKTSKTGSSRRSNRSRRSVTSRSFRSTRKIRRSRRGKRGLQSRDFRQAGLSAPKSRAVSNIRTSRRFQGGASTRTPVPAQMTFGTVRGEENFRSTSINHPEHGPGSCVAFSARGMIIGSNGVLLAYDYGLPIEVSSLYDQTAICGFLSADTKYASGVYLHPKTISQRISIEAGLWARWRYKWIRVTYNTYVATNNNGILHLALSRNPSLLIEGSRATSATAYPLTSLVAEAVPSMSVSRFGTCSVSVNKFENKLYKTDIDNLPLTAPDNSYGYIAYADERHCLRLVCLTGAGPAAGAVSPWGEILIEGEVEFFNPVPAGGYSIGFVLGTVAPPLSGETKDYPNKTVLHDGKWKSPHSLFLKNEKTPPVKLQIGIATTQPRFESKYESKYPVRVKRPASVIEEPDYDLASAPLSPP